MRVYAVAVVVILALRPFAASAQDGGELEPQIAEMAKKLQNPDPGIRADAVRTLSRLNSPKATELVLKAAAEDADDNVRAIAIMSLLDEADKQLVGALAGIKSSIPGVRTMCAICLSNFTDPVVIEPLCAALKDSADDVVGIAAISLYFIALNRRISLDETNGDTSTDPLLKDLRDKATAPLIAVLGKRNDEIRKGAIETLGVIGDPRGLEPVLEYIGDGNPDLRTASANALGYLQSPKAVDALILALKDTKEAVREAAFRSLGRQKAVKAVDLLIGALSDSSAKVRAAVAWALGEIPAPSAFDLLVKACKDENALVRAAAVESVSKLGGDRAIGIVAGFTADSSERVREASAWALRKFASDPVAFEALVRATKDSALDVRTAAVNGLAKSDRPEAVPLLVDALSDPEAKISAAAMTRLVALGTGCLPQVASACGGEPKPPVREACLKLASKMGPPAVDVLRKTFEGGQEPAKSGAAFLLGGLKDKGAVRILVEALKNPSPHVRRNAAEALGDIGDGSVARDVMEAFQTETDDAVKSAMRMAAMKLRRTEGPGRTSPPRRPGR